MRVHKLLSLGRRWMLAVVACFGVLGLAAAAWAMRVSPMVAEMTTSGSGSSARIEVGNVGSVSLPFETSITKIDINDAGEIIETPADENFLVFPPQGLVPVNGRQMVRVQWVGEPTMANSEAYYLSVRQLPVATEPGESEGGGSLNLTVLYNMKALLVVAPPGAEPKVGVVSVKPTTIEEPATPAQGDTPAKPATREPAVEVVVSNTGNRYALMSGATWLMEGTAKDGTPWRKTLTGGELSAVVGVGYLAPAGGRRDFVVATDGVELDPAKPITLRFGR